jgi:hypothetical protein
MSEKEVAAIPVVNDTVNDTSAVETDVFKGVEV